MSFEQNIIFSFIILISFVCLLLNLLSDKGEIKKYSSVISFVISLLLLVSCIINISESNNLKEKIRLSKLSKVK